MQSCKKAILVLLFLVLAKLQHESDAQSLRTVTRKWCDGQRFYLRCQGTINIVSSNYGRTSRSVCAWRKTPQQIANTNCRDGGATLGPIKTLCNRKSMCTYPLPVGPIPPFGDPCRGIAKYLELKYQCIPPPTPPTIGPPKKKTACRNKYAKADIYFMIDASGSVGTQNFVHLLRFTNTLINSLSIGQNTIRVGVFRFDHRTTLMFPLNRHYTKTALRNAVRYIPYTYGGTGTSLVLQQMRTVGFTARNGHRAGVQKIGILITDGIPRSVPNTLRQATLCKQGGITLYSIAAQTPAYAKASIRAIASDPKKGHSFVLDKFTQMTSKAPPIAKRICGTVNKKIPTTPPPPTTTTTTTSTTTTTTTTTTTLHYFSASTSGIIAYLRPPTILCSPWLLNVKFKMR
ncbi:collagen alpha-1(XIV) chain-like [Lineus longissimus]|uniref:collagen alpha-1(XIV) chain-like n=1 Tax=Lineus longissimus TaxID=88925 RepID=UPI00315CFAB0